MRSPWKQQCLQLFFALLLMAAATAATAATAAAATATLSTAPAPFVPPAATSSAFNSASNCSRSKHVVLASFGEPEEYHTVSLYFASKFPNASVHHLWLHLKDAEEKEVAQETMSKTATSAATFHWHQLLRKRTAELKKEATKATSRNRHKSSIDWRAFYRSLGIHRSVIDMASLDAYHKLRSTYLHSSVNLYEYELLCFARFIGLHEFCSSKKIDQLTWIDADIPIFDPDFLDRVCLPQGYSIWSLTNGSSFLNTMTCSEIGRFVDFMLDFYAKENRHALVRTIHEHGSSDMDNAKHISEQVRQAEPAFVELGIDPKHFSDMFLFDNFLNETNARANAAEAAAEVTRLAREQSEQKMKGDHPTTTIANAALSQTSRMVKHPKTYIHKDENGGTIDPYFVPIISIKNRVPYPDSQSLCTNDTIWNSYLKLSGGGGGSAGGGDAGGAGGGKQADEASTSVFTTTKTTTTTTTETKTKTATHATPSRLGLLFNAGGNDTWSPVPGAHFQAADCKARLLSTFSEAITEAHRHV